jgi:hypothetical protein
MSRNVHPSLIMLALKDLISTPLYSNLNVTINLQWNNLFSMHTTLFNQTNDQNNHHLMILILKMKTA